ncbi:hypothetical protein CKAH01_13648 [Colletotrichum kahawae]|uniref:Uncharacterized protein n=1 Tax=Colletotrichum kahawae TaxID=34407 RepID=A0AAE0DAT7_COLKA|nr:hypothetical protein CKAH01_13648 [Colletotrichum kahawae]
MFEGQNIRENLKQSVVEGLELAETAASVMRNHADDPWVQKMSKLVLGDRDTFQTRFEFARGIFERVAAFEREPSPLQPMTPEWTSRADKSNKDWATHTSQGGKLDDVSASGRLAESIPSCYEWECVLKLGAEPSIRAELNADSISMLAIALKVWTMHHYVDEKGVIHEIPQA